jgi:hypothetical protein
MRRKTCFSTPSGIEYSSSIHGRETIMMRLLSIVALAAGISGCVAAQPYDSGYDAVPAYEYSPGYYAPRTSIGIGVGGGGFGGGGGIGVGF